MPDSSRANVRTQDINLKFDSMAPPRGAQAHKLCISSAAHAPTLTLHELITARNLINDSLDVIDVSRWTGDAKNANFIAGQLRLLFDNVQEAKQCLKGTLQSQSDWWEDPVDQNVSYFIACFKISSLNAR